MIFNPLNIFESKLNPILECRLYYFVCHLSWILYFNTLHIKKKKQIHKLKKQPKNQLNLIGWLVRLLIMIGWLSVHFNKFSIFIGLCFN